MFCPCCLVADSCCLRYNHKTRATGRGKFSSRPYNCMTSYKSSEYLHACGTVAPSLTRYFPSQRSQNNQKPYRGGGGWEGGDEVPEMGWMREIVANVGNPQVSAGLLFPSRSEAHPGASSSCTATRGVPRVNDVPHNQLEDITSSSPQAAHPRQSYTPATFPFSFFLLFSYICGSPISLRA